MVHVFGRSYWGGGGRLGLSWIFIQMLFFQVPFKEKDEGVERLIPSGERVRKELTTEPGHPKQEDPT